MKTFTLEDIKKLPCMKMEKIKRRDYAKWTAIGIRNKLRHQLLEDMKK